MLLRPATDPWIPQRADPFVTRAADGTYYFTASVPAYDGIILRSAPTLDDLAQAPEQYIWHKHAAGPMGNHIWAPELHFLDGKWYIYFAAGDAEDKWRIRPYVLACRGSDPMIDPWDECGPMQPADEDEFSFRAFSLDATVFENHGKYYYVWAEKVGVGKMISNLYIAELETPTKLAAVQVLLSTPDYDWERRGFWVNEGPAVLKHAGHIYLTYSASDTGVNYCMGMLSVSEDAEPLDPANWTKARRPVLRTDESKQIYGPGHNSFTAAEDGTPVIVFHYRNERDIQGDPLYNPNRHATYRSIAWADDGAPMFIL